MTWRLAKALIQFREEVNAKFPNRSKSSDGTIGDVSHSTRPSDHNPNASGVVCAFDVTHDPAHECDSYALAEWLRGTKDNRISYVISNGRIFSATVQPWVWRRYSGANKHDHHMHLSVKGAVADDPRPWGLTTLPASSVTYVTPPPTLRLGEQSDTVKLLQSKLGITADGVFGSKTRAAVMKFQEHSGLIPDGIVGPATWKALG